MGRTHTRTDTGSFREEGASGVRRRRTVLLAWKERWTCICVGRDGARQGWMGSGKTRAGDGGNATPPTSPGGWRRDHGDEDDGMAQNSKTGRGTNGRSNELEMVSLVVVDGMEPFDVARRGLGIVCSSSFAGSGCDCRRGCVWWRDGSDQWERQGVECTIQKGVWYERTQPSMSYDGMSFPGVRATSLVVDARRKRGEKDA